MVSGVISTIPRGDDFKVETSTVVVAVVVVVGTICWLGWGLSRERKCLSRFLGGHQ